MSESAERSFGDRIWTIAAATFTVVGGLILIPEVPYKTPLLAAMTVGVLLMAADLVETGPRGAAWYREYRLRRAIRRHPDWPRRLRELSNEYGSFLGKGGAADSLQFGLEAVQQQASGYANISPKVYWQIAAWGSSRAAWASQSTLISSTTHNDQMSSTEGFQAALRALEGEVAASYSLAATVLNDTKIATGSAFEGYLASKWNATARRGNDLGKRLSALGDEAGTRARHPDLELVEAGKPTPPVAGPAPAPTTPQVPPSVAS